MEGAVGRARQGAKPWERGCLMASRFCAANTAAARPWRQEGILGDQYPRARISALTPGSPTAASPAAGSEPVQLMTLVVVTLPGNHGAASGRGIREYSVRQQNHVLQFL